ncbi:MAG TPA: 16S rRNA (cytosine(1402)-N(4))-methyltransferase RsmH [Chloroflexi bacterium]|nr:16S rRNA (cytosine(1402)-N(4))-methyltransferase RsmH [Chloroflexota bacterium]
MSASADASSSAGHTPVLYQPVLTALKLSPDGCYIDGTVGAGGHAEGILEGSAPNGCLLGLDRDPQALETAARRLSRFGERVMLRQGSYADMAAQAAALGWPEVDGILLDLGLSSLQLGDPARGFSFRQDGPLDMRFDPSQGLTAHDLVNEWDQSALAGVIFRYGEEPKARAIARAIVAARPIRTTLELAEVIEAAVGGRRGKIHPATRTFQALRIAVNQELEQLERGLSAAVGLLKPGGRLVVISFHSLEDRMVKTFFRRESQDCICPPDLPACRCAHVATLRLVTRKPIRPSDEEVRANPRARSARLRVAERLVVA